MIPRRLAESADRGDARHGISFGRDASGTDHRISRVDHFRIAWPNVLETPEERIRAMNETRVDVHAFSLSPLMHWYELDADTGIPMAQEANDDVAEMVATNPDRFAGLAFLPLQDPAAAIDELDRCITVHGFVGVMVGCHVDGLDWDSDELFPSWLQPKSSERSCSFIPPTDGPTHSSLVTTCAI